VDGRDKPDQTVWATTGLFFKPLSREAAPDQAGTARLFGKTLLPGDGVELLQLLFHRLPRIIAAAAERGVAFGNKIAVQDG
jgi:hypothetical protein